MKKIFGLLAALLIGVAVAHAAWQVLWKITGTGSRRNTTEFIIQPANTTDGTAADFVAGTTNTNALGTSSVRFSNVYTTLLNVSGATTQTGSLTIGTGSSISAPQANVAMQLSTAPETSSTLTFYSTGTLVYNTTDKYLCVSTGSNQDSFVIVSTQNSTTPCAH